MKTKKIYAPATCPHCGAVNKPRPQGLDPLYRFYVRCDSCHQTFIYNQKTAESHKKD